MEFYILKQQWCLSICLFFTYLLLLSILGPFFFGTLFLLLFHSFSQLEKTPFWDFMDGMKLPPGVSLLGQ
jgi:hypothetical protein